MMDENDDLHWHALNYRTAAPQHAETMWQELVACVERKVAAERERLCAAIKAADDKASESDYMLDSDDCISVIRGTWSPGA